MKSPAIIDKVLAAVNSGNTDMFLDLFAEDGEIDDWGSIYRGRAEIQRWSDRELIGAKARLTLRAAELHHDEVSMIVHIGDAGFRGLTSTPLSIAVAIPCRICSASVVLAERSTLRFRGFVRLP